MNNDLPARAYKNATISQALETRRIKREAADTDTTVRYDEYMASPSDVHAYMGDILQDITGEQIAEMIIAIEKAPRSKEIALKHELATFIVDLVTDGLWEKAETENEDKQ